MIILSEQQIQDVIEFLWNTDLNIEQGFQEFGINFNEVAEDSTDEIHAELFRCEECTFWSDQSDNVGSDVCSRCYAESEEGTEDEEESEED